MGGMLLTLKGETIPKVELEAQRRLTEAKNMGLCEEARTVPFKDKGLWTICMYLHS